MSRPRGQYASPYARKVDITKHPEYNVDEKTCTVCGETKPALKFDVRLMAGRSRLADICPKCDGDKNE